MTRVDTHVHYNDQDPVDYANTLIRRMDENGVDKCVLFGVQGDPMCADAGVHYAAVAHPDRIIPFACSLRCELDRDADVFLNYAFRGPWRGVGEIYVDLGGNPGTTYALRDGTQVYYPHYCPEDGPLNGNYARIFRECAERGFPVSVHCQSVSSMRMLLTQFPATKIIWAHCDHSLVEDDVIPMLEHHPNLFCEIGIQFRFEAAKLMGEPLGPEDAWLPRRFKAWQEAASRYPSRLLWGSDVFMWSDLDDPEVYRIPWEVFGLFCKGLSQQAVDGIAGQNLLSLLPE